MTEQRYLYRKEAAQYLTERGLKVSAGTLAKYATVGGGPNYQHFGNRPVYTPASLEEWILSRLSEPRQNSSQRSYATRLTGARFPFKATTKPTR